MIGVLTLFGETDLQPVLSGEFIKENIAFIKENCVTSVQLMGDIDEYHKETDVVIIYSAAINMESFPELVSYIRNAESGMRIVLVLDGKADSYLRSKLDKIRDMQVDLFFDDNGFEIGELVKLLKLGKLPKKKQKDKHREGGFKEFTTSKLPDKPKERDIKSGIESFSAPQGHYMISVINSMHGAGATYTALNLAKYFAIQNFKTCFLDISGTQNFTKNKLGKVDMFNIDADIDNLKSIYNVVVADMGTPYEIGECYDEYKVSKNYPLVNFRLIMESDLKILLGSTDSWNIGKMIFFLNNNGWMDLIDESFVFIVQESPEKLKKTYPEANVMCRNDDYREKILELFWEDELK